MLKSTMQYIYNLTPLRRAFYARIILLCLGLLASSVDSFYPSIIGITLVITGLLSLGLFTMDFMKLSRAILCVITSHIASLASLVSWRLFHDFTINSEVIYTCIAIGLTLIVFLENKIKGVKS